MHFQSPCHGVTFCDIFGKDGVKINVRHLPRALGQIIPPKKTVDKSGVLFDSLYDSELPNMNGCAQWKIELQLFGKGGSVILSPSQLFKFLDYSLNPRDIALPQAVVFFLSSFRNWI